MNYAEALGVPHAFSSNDGAFLMHDCTGLGDKTGQLLEDWDLT